jgi:CRP-like cAMP-binding protein
MSMLTNKPRSASLKMLTDGEVVRIPRDAIERLTRERPAGATLLYRNLARVLAERVRVTTHWLTESPPL